MPSNKEWWFTDNNGRRIGYMTPERLSTLLAGFYNDRFFVKLFAEDFGYTKPSIYRWLDGTVPVPKAVAMIVAMLPSQGRPEKLPTLNADWLPKTPKASTSKASKEVA